MTAILAFYTNNGDKLIVVSDRLVDHEYGSRENDKFFRKGRFILFCAGSEEVYMGVARNITNQRRSITCLAKAVVSESLKIMKTRRSCGHRDEVCSFIIADIEKTQAIKINNGTIYPVIDMELIGDGNKYRDEVYNRFTKFAPDGTQIKNLTWNELFIPKIIEVYDSISKKSPVIGHPATFGLDLFSFYNAEFEYKTIRYRHNLTQETDYKFQRVDI